MFSFILIHTVRASVDSKPKAARSKKTSVVASSVCDESSGSAPNVPRDIHPPAVPKSINPPAVPKDINPPAVPKDINPPAVVPKDKDINPPAVLKDINPPESPSEDINPPDVSEDINSPSSPQNNEEEATATAPLAQTHDTTSEASDDSGKSIILDTII